MAQVPSDHMFHAGVLRLSLLVCSVPSVFFPACVFLPAETGISAAGPDGCAETEVSRTPSPQRPDSALDAPEVHTKANLHGIKWS